MQASNLWNLGRELGDKLNGEGVELYLGGAKIVNELIKSIGKIKLLVFSGWDAQRREATLIHQEREKGIQRFLYRLDSLLLEIVDFKEGGHPVLDDKSFRKMTTREADDILEELRLSFKPGGLFIEGQLIGRDHDKRKLTKFAEDLQSGIVFPILGNPGVGKTTLAGVVFSELQYTGKFSLVEWVSLDQVSTHEQLLMEVCLSIGCIINARREMERLLDEFSNRVQNQKCLLVIDNLSNEKLLKALVSEDMKDPFYSAFVNFAAEGSKIIVTATVEGASTNLKELNVHDSWLLLQCFAFRGGEEHQDDLSHIGHKICHRCGNIPAVIKIIAAVLSSKRNMEEWEHFHNIVLTSVRDPIHTILSVVSLLSERSIDEEKNTIKRKCFAYCSLFPLDYGLKKGELFHLWKAQGYYGQSVKNPEDDFDKYFVEFVKNEYFSEDNNQDASASAVTYKMSHLAYELMKHVAGEAFYTVGGSSQEVDLNIIRHASFLVSSSWQLPSWLSRAKHLRSLMFWLSKSNEIISIPFVKDWPNMKHIRALCLGAVLCENRSSSILSVESLLVWVTTPGNLPGPILQLILFAKLHFYVGGVFSDLSAVLEETQKIMKDDSSSTVHEDDKELVEIPKLDLFLESIVIRYWKGVHFPAWVVEELFVLLPNLVSVQIVHCSRCRYLPDFSKLPGLRSLELWGVNSLEYIEIGGDNTSKATSTTAFFPCLKYLMLVDLPELKGWIRTELGDYQYILLQAFPLLTEVRIRGCPKLMSMASAPMLESLEATHIQARVLRHLLHLSVLRELQIDSCIGLEWGNTTNRVDERSCVRIGELWQGLSNLHSLQLTNISYMRKLPVGLKSLTTLQQRWLSWLHDLQELPDWIGYLPQLRRLSIQYCPKLRALPDSLESLTNLEQLEIIYCPRLKQIPILKSSAQVSVQECLFLERLS